MSTLVYCWWGYVWYNLSGEQFGDVYRKRCLRFYLKLKKLNFNLNFTGDIACKNFYLNNDECAKRFVFKYAIACFFITEKNWKQHKCTIINSH